MDTPHIHTSMNSLLTEYPIVVVLGEMDRLLNLPDDDESPHKENPKIISSILHKIEALFIQLGETLNENISFLTPSSLRGFLNDLQQLKDILTLYQSKSRLYKLVHCRGLNDILTTMVHKLAHSLATVALGLPENSELCNSFNNVSSEMKSSQLKVSDVEDLICSAIDVELNNGTNDSANDTFMINLARELRMMNRHDVSQFSSEIELYKQDIEDSISPRDLRIVDILEKLFRNQSSEPREAALSPRVANTAVAAELEEKPIPAFKTFICPLSREVMRNPVVLLETGQTYEQKEIEKWFKCCAQDGRQPTCPMTGQVLTSLAWRKNLVLQSTIEEWNERNTSAQITRAKQKLSSNLSIKDFEDVVDELFRISEESLHHKHTLRNAGIIPLLLGPWHGPLEDGHSLRYKVLDMLCSMASQNEENKLEMADENVIRFAVKSLTSNLEREKESAARLLCELSSQPEVCAKIGYQKGAILLLSGFVSSGENAMLANLANQTLKNLQRDYANIISMAEAGRLEPLLDCLSEGPFDVKLQMVSYLSCMTLSNNDKEMAVKEAGPFLIEMLSCENIDKDVALTTLLMLSTPANAATLVNFGILPPLFSFLDSMPSGTDTPSATLKEKAAELFANMLSHAGHWESHTISSDGTTLQSESAIHCFLKLLNRMGLKLKYSLLRILYYIAWSPQTADAAAQHIQSGNGITVLTVCLRESDNDINLQTLKLLGVLSLRKASEVAEELRQTNQFDFLKSLLKGFEPEKQAAAAFILANVSLSEREIVEVLGIELIPWIIIELNKSKSSRIKKGDAASFTLMEGLIGLLLQFCKGSDTHILHALREHRVMMVLKEYMGFSSQPSVKKLAAQGLKMLSEKTPNQVDEKPPPSHCCFAFYHKSERLPQATCHVHGTMCEEATTFCLVKVHAVRPLVDLLEVEDVGVQVAALGALSTLLVDSINLKSGIEELAKVDCINAIIELFCTAHLLSAELQEKLVWMIERVTRVEEMCQKHSMNQVLIKTLVQSFRSTSNPATKRLSQNALTNLKQISGMTGVKR